MFFAKKLLLQEQRRFTTQIWDVAGEYDLYLPQGTYLIEMTGGGGAGGNHSSRHASVGTRAYGSGWGGSGGNGRSGFLYLTLQYPNLKPIKLTVGAGGTLNGNGGAGGTQGIGGDSWGSPGGAGGGGGHITMITYPDELLRGFNAPIFNSGSDIRVPTHGDVKTLHTNFGGLVGPNAFYVNGGGGGGGGGGARLFGRYCTGSGGGGGGGYYELEQGTIETIVQEKSYAGGAGGNTSTGAPSYSGQSTNYIVTTKRGGDGGIGSASADSRGLGGNGYGAGGGAGTNGYWNSNVYAGAGGGGAGGYYGGAGGGAGLTDDSTPSGGAASNAVDFSVATPSIVGPDGETYAGQYGAGGAPNTNGSDGWIRVTRVSGPDSDVTVEPYTAPIEITEPLENGVKYVRLPAGRFYMGVKSTNGGDLDEGNFMFTSPKVLSLYFGTAPGEVYIASEWQTNYQEYLRSIGNSTIPTDGFIKIVQLADIDEKLDFGRVRDSVTETQDFGSVADSVTETEDWGTITK